WDFPSASTHASFCIVLSASSQVCAPKRLSSLVISKSFPSGPSASLLPVTDAALTIYGASSKIRLCAPRRIFIRLPAAPPPSLSLLCRLCSIFYLRLSAMDVCTYFPHFPQ